MKALIDYIDSAVEEMTKPDGLEVGKRISDRLWTESPKEDTVKLQFFNRNFMAKLIVNGKSCTFDILKEEAPQVYADLQSFIRSSAAISKRSEREFCNVCNETMRICYGENTNYKKYSDIPDLDVRVIAVQIPYRPRHVGKPISFIIAGESSIDEEHGYGIEFHKTNNNFNIKLGKLLGQHSEVVGY